MSCSQHIAWRICIFNKKLYKLYTDLNHVCSCLTSYLRGMFESYLHGGLGQNPSPSATLATSRGLPGNTTGNLSALLHAANDTIATEAYADSPGAFGQDGLEHRTGLDSGVITPEEGSNITSSDAATVHSSASGEPSHVMITLYCSDTYFLPPPGWLRRL